MTLTDMDHTPLSLADGWVEYVPERRNQQRGGLIFATIGAQKGGGYEIGLSAQARRSLGNPAFVQFFTRAQAFALRADTGQSSGRRAVSRGGLISCTSLVRDFGLADRRGRIPGHLEGDLLVFELKNAAGTQEGQP